MPTMTTWGKALAKMRQSMGAWDPARGGIALRRAGGDTIVEFEGERLMTLPGRAGKREVRNEAVAAFARAVRETAPGIAQAVAARIDIPDGHVFEWDSKSDYNFVDHGIAHQIHFHMRPEIFGEADGLYSEFRVSLDDVYAIMFEDLRSGGPGRGKDLLESNAERFLRADDYDALATKIAEVHNLIVRERFAPEPVSSMAP